MLAGAAYAGYLASITVQTWARARRPRAYRAPIVAYGSAFAVLGLALVVTFPALLLTLLVFVPAGLIVFGGARPGTKRDLANSLAQVAQAIVLVPAAAHVSGTVDRNGWWRTPWSPPPTSSARSSSSAPSCASEATTGSPRSRSASTCVVTVAAALTLPWPYALVAAGLTARAIGLPLAQRRWAGGSHPLRPVHVGIVEIVSSLAVVVVSFAVPL